MTLWGDAQKDELNFGMNLFRGMASGAKLLPGGDHADFVRHSHEIYDTLTANPTPGHFWNVEVADAVLGGALAGRGEQFIQALQKADPSIDTRNIVRHLANNKEFFEVSQKAYMAEFDEAVLDDTYKKAHYAYQTESEALGRNRAQAELSAHIQLTGMLSGKVPMTPESFAQLKGEMEKSTLIDNTPVNARINKILAEAETTMKANEEMKRKNSQDAAFRDLSSEILRTAGQLGQPAQKTAPAKATAPTQGAGGPPGAAVQPPPEPVPPIVGLTNAALKTRDMASGLAGPETQTPPASPSDKGTSFQLGGNQ